MLRNHKYYHSKPMMFTDESLMPYGKFKDTKMANVPAWHLLWLWDNDRCNFGVGQYIQENMELLIKESQK